MEAVVHEENAGLPGEVIWSIEDVGVVVKVAELHNGV